MMRRGTMLCVARAAVIECTTVCDPESKHKAPTCLEVSRIQSQSSSNTTHLRTPASVACRRSTSAPLLLSHHHQPCPPPNPKRSASAPSHPSSEPRSTSTTSTTSTSQADSAQPSPRRGPQSSAHVTSANGNSSIMACRITLIQRHRCQRM